MGMFMYTDGHVMYRWACLCTDGHVYVQMGMFMYRWACLCTDLIAFIESLVSRRRVTVQTIGRPPSRAQVGNFKNCLKGLST